MNNTQVKAMLASYGRSVLGAAVALYLSGVTDPAKLFYALLAAVVPVAIRALNPKDKVFGLMPSTTEVANALSTANVDAGQVLENFLKAEVNKVVAKKPTPAKKPATKTTPKK
jgi:hypothetical protein